MDQKYRTRRAVRHDLLATTMLAGLALPPATWASAQTATLEPGGATVGLPTIDVDGPGGGLGGRFTGYSVDLNKPAASSKTNIPLLQNPTAIQVVPREVMDDQQAISVKDAIVQNVSGVSLGNQFYDRFIIRGFDTGGFIYRNGLRTCCITQLETANLQSIEVVKGPSAFLYGRIEPGGLINLVTKQPLLVPYFSVEEQFGSFGLTRTTVDATGPLTADKTLAYRVNFAYLNTNSFRDFGARENIFVAPTVSYQPNDQFRLNIEGEYQSTSWVDDLGDVGIPAIGRRPANIPISRYLEDPAITLANRNQQQRSFIGYDATFNLNQNWRMINRFGVQNVNYDQYIPFAYDLDETTGELQRATWIMPDFSRHSVSANLDLQGEFDTGPFNHAVLVGTDYMQFNSHAFGLCCDNVSFLRPINIWRPIYNGTGLGPFTSNYFSINKETWKGIYAQDQISFADDRLHFLIGGRYDWANTGSGFSSMSGAEAATAFINNPTDAFSPRLGAVVQPLPWLSFYGSFSQSFGTANGRTPDNTILPPQEATQFEGGAKAEFFDGRLTATMAFYDIIKTNILARVPGTLFSVPVGEAESKGVEFDIAGRINENWSLIGNYSHDDARVTKDSMASGGLGNTGHRLTNVPLDAANLWVKYDADGDFRGLSLGAGLNVVGERQGDLANTFQLPTYTLVNAMIMYRFHPAGMPWVRNLTWQLNVKNLLDATYYESSSDRFSIVPGTPRTILVSLRAEF